MTRSPGLLVEDDAETVSLTSELDVFFRVFLYVTPYTRWDLPSGARNKRARTRSILALSWKDTMVTEVQPVEDESRFCWSGEKQTQLHFEQGDRNSSQMNDQRHNFYVWTFKRRGGR